MPADPRQHQVGHQVTDALHVRGVVLPEREHRDVWVVDGRVTYERVREATTVAEGWILPGMVDAHCHVGLDENGAIGPEAQEEQAVTDRDAGVLLLRDAGSAADTRWIDDRADLPKIIRAGRHLARTRRYIRNYAHEIEPDALVGYVEEQARRSDGWVKLVGDWIDRDKGDLGPCWPKDALEAAISAAHACGARVTAHVFGEDALPDLLDAGIDCIEHGTGLSSDLVEVMAARGVGLVPTLVNTANFPSYAEQGEGRFPAYGAHMRDLYERRYAIVRAAYEAGVPIYAGTDAAGGVPHGLVAREVAELVNAGLAPADAIGSASWRARSWLGRPGLAEGDPADLVVLAEDPEVTVATLTAPMRVILRGRVVG